MEVLNSAKSTRKKSETAEKGKKVHWRCVVPGCKSNSNIKRHSFPKDVTRSQEWRAIINNPELDELTSDELCYYRVCQMHFSESAYKITACRQVLREEAVPELNLNLTSCMPRVTRESTRKISLDIKVAVDKKMQVDCTLENPVNEFSDLKVMPNWGDICVDRKSSPPPAPDNTSELHGKKTVEETRNQHCGSDDQIISVSVEKKSNVLLQRPFIASILKTSKNTRNDSLNEPIIASTAKTSKNDSAKKSSIASTPKYSKKRLLLGSVTKKSKLTPVAKRLHVTSSNLLKKQSKYVHRLGTMKGRVQSAEKYITVKMKELKSLSKEQLAFVEMQIRNVHKKAKEGEKCLPSCRFH